MAHLQLLGSPILHREDERVDLPIKQSLLLGSYLAYREDWVQRDELLALFWPDQDEKTARHNLSQLLYESKRQPWATGLEVERNRVRWPIATDVQAFREAIGSGSWDEAVGLYEGELLGGVLADENPSYQDWLSREREELQADWREAVLKHAAVLEGAGTPRRAAALLREVLRHDTLAEDVLQAYMRCAAADGQRDQALRAFESFRSTLHSELEVEPLEATLLLADGLREAAGVGPLHAPTVPTAPPLRNFPTSSTPFVGRDLELAELGSRLLDPETRLLTLVGPGGIGKSRLAQQLARSRADTFAGGATFVPLASVPAPDLLADTALAAFGLERSGRRPPLEQLLDYLADRETLLLLDNVEHLLEAVSDVATLLDTAPGLRVLATSREPLDLPGEVLYELEGLSFPADESWEDVEAYDAVALFLRSARRVHRHFHLGPHNHADVIHLCRLLGGLPLGLELAAAWVRLLTPGELVEELGTNLDLLRSEGGMPERHRSLQAVFEHSWALLSEREQQALSDLAVFRGGFTKDAATEVGEVSLRTLLALVNKSLLQRTSSGRFERHVTVRQFALDRLAADPERNATMLDRHAGHYVRLAERLRPLLDGPEQGRALTQLEGELDNLRSAFEHLLDVGRSADAVHLYGALGPFWRRRGHVAEGRRLFERLKQRPLPPPNGALAATLNSAGILASHQGEYERSRALHQQALEIGEALDDDGHTADALTNLGAVCWHKDDYPGAEAYLLRALELRRTLDNDAALAGVLNNLGNLARDGNRYDLALSYYDEALALARKIGHRWEIANTSNNRAIVHAYRGDLESAGVLFAEALEVQRELGDRRGMSMSMTNLGNTLMDRGSHQEATALYLEALELDRELGDRLGEAHIHNNLGILAGYERRFDEAHRHYLEALTIRHRHGKPHGVALTLNCFVDLALLEGDPTQALTLIGAIDGLLEQTGIPYPPHIDKLHQGYLQQATAAVGHDASAVLLERGRALSLDEVNAFAAARSAETTEASLSA
jgi:predicted ATPase/DNA-binding SARP family transcriptional activator/Tfp pilus assembly protein PilF